MKVTAISSPEGARELLANSKLHGYTAFIYHHADPKRELVDEKFLYVNSDDELKEKVNLLLNDFTIVQQL